MIDLIVLCSGVEFLCCKHIYEPVHEKTNNLGFRPGLTQTRLYSYRIKLKA